MEGLVVTVSPKTLDHLDKIVEVGVTKILRLNGSFVLPDLNRVKACRLPILLDIPGHRIGGTKKRTSSQSDEELMAVAVKERFNYVGVSYAKNADDIKYVRRCIKEFGGQDCVHIVGKVETAEAMENLQEIILASDIVMIDRGDLGVAIGPTNVPRAVDKVVKMSQFLGKKVIVATEMMMSTCYMSNPAKATFADLSDCYRSLTLGANYVMCSEETAIGEDPLYVVSTVKLLLEEAKKAAAERGENSFYPLVCRKAPGSMLDKLLLEADGLLKLSADTSQCLDIEKIADGTFSPLQGFLSQHDYASVIKNMRLSSGTPWPIPIIFQVNDEDKYDAVEVGQKVAISSPSQGNVAILEIESMFEIDKEAHKQAVYGTTDMSHPGVAFFDKKSSKCLGGIITYIGTSSVIEKDVSPSYMMSPEVVRQEIRRRGWKTCTGFQTRNLPHRAHEYLQRIAMETTDGILIHPIVGWKKPGDFLPKAVLEGYEIQISEFYNSNRVILAALTTAMRYAGPREALFHAIIRRNFGCTHFIIGRDHAGVGNFYGKYDAHKLVSQFDPKELGITPMLLSGPMYCNDCEQIVTDKTCPHSSEAHVDVSATNIRACVTRGELPNLQLIRRPIAKFMVAKQSEGQLFLS